MRSENRSYLPRLDYLRGFAAWLVVFHHAAAYFPLSGPVPNFWAGAMNPFLVVASQGWLGVGLFLMISGFSLGRGLNGKSVSWGGYLGARWLRIAPLYLVMLILGTIGMGATPAPAEFLAALTLLPVPGAYSPGAWAGVTWSIRIEFILYFALPAFYFLARNVKMWKLAIMGPLFLGFVMILLVRNGAESDAILYWGVPGRLLEFAVGFFLGYFAVSARRQLRTVLGLVSLVGFLGLALLINRRGGFLEIGPELRFSAYLAAICLAACALIWANDAAPWRWRPADICFRSIGTWSYSTYMWHAVILTLVVVPFWEFLGSQSVDKTTALSLGLAATMILVALMSWLSFSLVEAPFLALRPRYIRQEESPVAPSGSLDTGVGTIATGVVAVAPTMPES